MSESTDNYDVHFFQLLFSLQAGAMQQMGKIASPLTGKVEKDLNLAKASIDMLDMLQRKTRGNLTPEEKRLIDHILYELRLNYIEEVKKGDHPAKTENETEKTAPGGEKPSPEKPDFRADKTDKNS
ncbi:MAG: DUF1844 domain-containing protein [candidate division Zixibacteria bacterium]|nr:DUF1844 domain-containing protein [candidate division Zixibacteria bacterium]MDD5425527.1 DUF1844 domain-containing protein [candidate division Zixibacteria bacterium]